jgi:hypothetical protein
MRVSILAAVDRRVIPIAIPGVPALAAHVACQMIVVGAVNGIIVMDVTGLVTQIVMGMVKSVKVINAAYRMRTIAGLPEEWHEKSFF